MAVWDRRVRSALQVIGRCPKFGAGVYGLCLEELDRLIKDALAGDDQRSWKGATSNSRYTPSVGGSSYWDN
jgi:hypothetical protein